MKRFALILCVLFACALQSCLLFKVYNGRAAYKDTQREVELTTDTTIIVGNKAARAVENSSGEIERKAATLPR